MGIFCFGVLDLPLWLLGKLDGARTCVVVCILHHDTIDQLRIGTQLFGDGRLQQTDVMLFKPLVEELAGHLNTQHLFLQFHRLDGRNQVLKLLIDVVLYMVNILSKFDCAVRSILNVV